MAVIQQFGKIPLTEHFVDADGHAVGEIQAPAGISHGHPDTVILIGGQQCLRQPGVLPPKDEVRAVRIRNIGVTLRCFGRKVIEGAAVFGKEIRICLPNRFGYRSGCILYSCCISYKNRLVCDV